jgi:cysteine desulfuration protein SufE
VTESITERKQKVIEEIGAITDKDERLRYIIQQGRSMPKMDDSLKIDHFLVKGCISKAWLAPQLEQGRVTFHADSEAMIVKGIIAILLRVYNDSTPQEILATDADFLGQVGVTEHLSMNRRNGLSNILKMIKTYATAFQGA